jgi:hypothetical protein
MDFVIPDQNIEEQFKELSNTVEPMKQAAQLLVSVAPHKQSDMIMEVPETEKGLNDKQNNTEGVSISKPCEAACQSVSFNSESPSYDEAEQICSVGDKEQNLGKFDDEEAEKQECLDDCAEPVNEKTLTYVKSKSSTKTKAPDMLSTLVVEL